MFNSARPTLFYGLATCSLAGALWLSLNDWSETSGAATKTEARTRVTNTADHAPLGEKSSRDGNDGAMQLRDDSAARIGAIEGERVIMFANVDELNRFLQRAGGLVEVVNRVDDLAALRIRFSQWSRIAGLLGEGNRADYIFPIVLPNPQGGDVSPNATPLGSGLLSWLGVDGSDPHWGQGVKIAILDTGVAAHSALSKAVKNVNLIAPAADDASWNGHGTAVASLILGQLRVIPGVAPGADLTSYRVANDLGQSDTWTLALAIRQAVDAGNQILSISMGTYGESSLLHEAVNYALSKNVVIVAAAGNDGYGVAAKPAAYQGVIKALAVDAENEHLGFSNLVDQQLAISAPGWQVNAAYPEEKLVKFSGTSASAPIIAGVIATTMTEGGTRQQSLTPQQAVNFVFQNTYETGKAGYDSSTGSGAVNLKKLFDQKSGIPVNDASVASLYITEPGSDGRASVQVNIQNQGTQTLSNVPVQVVTPAGTTTLNVPSLAPGAVRSFELSLPDDAFDHPAGFTIDARIKYSDDVQRNDTRQTIYLPKSGR